MLHNIVTRTFPVYGHFLPIVKSVQLFQKYFLMQGQNGITFFTPNITLSSGHFFNKDQLYLGIFSSYYKRCAVKDTERVKKNNNSTFGLQNRWLINFYYRLKFPLNNNKWIGLP